MQNKKATWGLILILSLAICCFGLAREPSGNYDFNYEIAELQAPKYNQQNMESLTIQYAGVGGFDFCKKVELGHHFFYYLGWSNDALRVFAFEDNEGIGGSMIFRDDVDIWVNNKHYVVFGQNPEHKYSQYTLQITENGRVIKNITVDISKEDYILDAYLLDNYYNWNLTYN